MECTKKEAARQILADVSDVRAMAGMVLPNELSLKLANIREKAAWLYEGDQPAVKVMEGYERDFADSMQLLADEIFNWDSGMSELTSETMLHLIRLAEIFVNRGRVLIDRRIRYQMEVDNG